jgi:hypothetical protein
MDSRLLSYEQQCQGAEMYSDLMKEFPCTLELKRDAFSLIQKANGK